MATRVGQKTEHVLIVVNLPVANSLLVPPVLAHNVRRRVPSPENEGSDRGGSVGGPLVTEELKAKVVVVGAPGVGKTSLVRRYVLNEFSEKYKVTLGAIVYKRTEEVAFENRSVQVTMTLWDTMGDPGLADPLREVYLQGVQGVFGVCDVTEGTTLPPMDRWMNAALEAAGEVPVQILMNKWDLGPKVEVKFAGLTSGLGHAAPCWLTSAKSGDNVANAFHDLARRIVERHLVPVDGQLDAVDAAVLGDLDAGPKTAEEVASHLRIAHVVADAHLERLRRQSFVRLATMGLDEAGRPRLSYGRTDRVSAEVVTIER